jgi:hypothetical protein
MPTQEPAVTVRRKQSAQSKRATLELLRSKQRAEKEVSVLFPVGDGKTEEVTFLFKAIGAQEWDRLVSKYPPTAEQRSDGSPFNMHTFAPALLSRVCTDPALSEEEWKEIWDSPDWNRGEVLQFYAQAVDLCSTGMDIPFSGRD